MEGAVLSKPWLAFSLASLCLGAAVSDRARSLHQKALVFDAHIHAIEREFYHGGDIGERKPDGQFDLPRAREGGVGAMFFSFYVTEDYYPGRFETKQALRLIDACIRQIRDNSSTIEIAHNATEIERIHEAGKIAAVLGMVINVSHASDDAISQAIDLSTDPLIATHHGLREFNDIPRNMPDWLLKKLASKGGVIGFQIGNEFHNRKLFEWRTQNAGKPFWDTNSIANRKTPLTIFDIDQIAGRQFPMAGYNVPEELKFSVADWVAVVDRAIQLVGEDHVALGTDFDGGPTLPKDMRDVRDLPMITDAMLQRGYSEERIRKFLGGNILRVFRQITAKGR